MSNKLRESFFFSVITPTWSENMLDLLVDSNDSLSHTVKLFLFIYLHRSFKPHTFSLHFICFFASFCCSYGQPAALPGQQSVAVERPGARGGSGVRPLACRAHVPHPSGQRHTAAHLLWPAAQPHTAGESNTYGLHSGLLLLEARLHHSLFHSTDSSTVADMLQCTAASIYPPGETLIRGEKKKHFEGF